MLRCGGSWSGHETASGGRPRDELGLSLRSRLGRGRSRARRMRSAAATRARQSLCSSSSARVSRAVGTAASRRAIAAVRSSAARFRSSATNAESRFTQPDTVCLETPAASAAAVTVAPPRRAASAWSCCAESVRFRPDSSGMVCLRLVLCRTGRVRGVILCIPFPRLRHEGSRRRDQRRRIRRRLCGAEQVVGKGQRVPFRALWGTVRGTVVRRGLREARRIGLCGRSLSAS